MLSRLNYNKNKKKTYKNNKNKVMLKKTALKINRKTSINRKTFKTRKTSKNRLLKGGMFLDKGGFGCVITPALKCNVSKKINLNKSVSKIIRSEDEDVINEITISKLLQEIDPNDIYFISIKDNCLLTEIPKERTDIIGVKYSYDGKKKTYNTSEKPNLDKKHCDLDLDENPINLIMPFGGLSLNKLMKYKRKDNTNIKSIIHQLFVTNIKLLFKHLLIGLEKLHRNRIVHKDIKQKNIMVYLDPKEIETIKKLNVKEKNPSILTLIKIRYIDFGLSAHLTNNRTIKLDDIYLQGTYRYLPIERFIIHNLKKYKYETKEYKEQKILKSINQVKNSPFDALKRINETQLLSNLNKETKNLIEKLLYLYENDRQKLLDKCYGINNVNKYNGYIQKSDIYSLGISIFDTLEYEKNSNVDVRQNKLLYDLLLKMIELNPEIRYNVIECINHPYFTTN
jgi:serine/threonine protein kinase